ncbi:hypothetical protein NP233_g4378 [Leucocoprinus birnbaumii]|uniref:Beta'-coat protein n=1 Tax=Leucocoprinus birnbaumii TaxID=56174 RepID=A0AAD5VUT1_9AGAR|nr:hypothetical protein NP233_g4378 [Leucocoprinus birnbaumii]
MLFDVNCKLFARSERVKGVDFHPTEPWLLTGLYNGTVNIYNLDSGAVIKTFEVADVPVRCVKFIARKNWVPTLRISLFSSYRQDVVSWLAAGQLYDGSARQGRDDKTVKVWDYLGKSYVQMMEGHMNNVSFAVFHPNLPIIIEDMLSYALERAWCLALCKDTNEVAVGFDKGVVAIKLGRDEPTFSMDPSGKLIYTRNHEVLSGNLATLTPTDLPDSSSADGSRIPLSTKDIGSTEIFASSLLHSPNGRFVTVVGDGEYIIYTALAWRNKSFGNSISFTWAPDSNTYAVLESRMKLKVFKNFKEKGGAGMKGAGSFPVEAIYTGPVLGARGPGYVMFWDWETGEIVRRIDVDAKNIFWSTTGTLVAIVSDDSFYILRFDRDAYQGKIDEGPANITDEGVEESFEVGTEISDSVHTINWIGNCLVHTTTTISHLCYLIDSSHTVSPYAAPGRLYLLAYSWVDLDLLFPILTRQELCDTTISEESLEFPANQKSLK